ncbi:MAG: hypothetical protein NWP79_10595 [Paracoccaceae bacterium]|nr:hypothetical protein [Paracoccaceae bacterium]
MSISTVTASSQREAHLKSKVIGKLRDLRRATRAVMQRYEGAANLSEDESATYGQLTLSMVLLNSVSDHLANSDTLPKTWDSFTLGSDFDLGLIPLLQKRSRDELWVEYFECRRPKDFLVLVAGAAAEQLGEDGPVVRPRQVRARHASQATMPAQEATRKTIMEMIRDRMPTADTAIYKPKRG